MSSANDNTQGPLPPPATGSVAVLATIVILAAIADVLLVAAGLRQVLPVPALLALHVCLVPAIWLAARRCDPTLLAIAIISVLVLGPVGALGTLFLAALLAPGRSRSADGLQAKWHGRLSTPNETDLARQLAQAIGEGRLRPPCETAPVSFQEVSRKGTAAQRQTMLGLVSQRYDPAFNSVLRQELRSDNAAVRVSAAAVFSRLREKNRQMMGVGMSISDYLGANEAVVRGIALARGVMSGLLDPADIVSTREKSLDLLLQARPQASVADELEELIATLMFDSGLDEQLEERLNAIGPVRSAVLRSLHARLLMKTGRTLEAADVLQRRQDRSVRLSLARRSDEAHPLLSHRPGDGQ